MSFIADDLGAIFDDVFAEDVTYGTTTGVASIWSNPSDLNTEREGLIADWWLVQIPVVEIAAITPAIRDTITRYPGTTSAETWYVHKIMKEGGLYSFEVQKGGRVIPR